MTEASAIIERCRLAGVTLEPTDHGTIRVSATMPPSPELVEAIRAHKTDILALVAGPIATESTNTSATPAETEWCAVCGTARSYLHSGGTTNCPVDHCQHCWNFGTGVSVCSWGRDPSASRAFRPGAQ